MPVTYKLISTITVSTATTANIDFQNIPAIYDDLVLHLSARYDGSGSPNTLISFNNLTTSFTSRVLYGDGTSAGSTDAVDRFIAYNSLSTNTASTFGSGYVYIPNYAGSTNKSYAADSASETNGTTAYIGMVAGLRSNTAAITQITFTPSSGNFVQYSSASLYGIKKS